MTRRATWHRLAEEDLTEAYLHIGEGSVMAAERLLDAVERAVAVLLARPRAGRQHTTRSEHAQNIRTWVVRGFENYLVCYRPRPGGIEIVRFLHGSRDLPSILRDEGAG